MQQVNFKHCWIDSASARYEQEYMISFIISQKSVMPDRILRRYLLSSTSPAAASVRLLISTAPLSTLFYSLHAFTVDVNPFIHILNFYILYFIYFIYFALPFSCLLTEHEERKKVRTRHPDRADLYMKKARKKI